MLRRVSTIDVNSLKSFKDQNYFELKSNHDENNLFEDPFFEATDDSLYHNEQPPLGIKWMRPKEARENPGFVVDGFSRCDLDQGYIGNCWFIAACVGIMQSPKLFARVVPRDQDFDENYAGIFHFRFWLYGQWVDVVVDDRLPYWPDGKLVFCSNKEEPNEFWGPLLEKAYAKIYGSYENLEAGQTYDAFVDMSGGVPETFNLKMLEYKEHSKFWNIIHKSYEKGSIMSCSIDPDPRVREAIQYNGLVKGHAFTITKVAIVETKYGREFKLIRIRNPWGNEVEWKGAWSDKSSEWFSITEEKRNELEFNIKSDGEFWMSFEDFMRNWDVIQICHLSLKSFSDELFQTDDDENLTWVCNTHHCGWETGHSAGGCGQFNQAKFWTNPQFIITLQDVDDNDNEDLATVIISLMQKDTRLRRITSKQDSDEEYIQFRFFKIKDEINIDEYIDSSVKLHAHQLERIGSSGSYINVREVTKRFRVKPGNYLIIPSTYDEDHDCEFMLRIFTEKLIETNPLVEDKEPSIDEENEESTFFTEKSGNSFSDWLKLLNNDNIREEENERTNPYFKNKKNIRECKIM